MRRFFPMFLGILALAAFFFGSLTVNGCSSQFPETGPKIDAGLLKDFPAGTIKPLPLDKVIIFSDPDGIYAISSRCTHLGCMVIFKNSEGICPCHGSKFDKDGVVLKGPARENLAWFLVEAGPGGRLIVDKTKTVPAGTKYRFDKS